MRLLASILFVSVCASAVAPAQTHKKTPVKKAGSKTAVKKKAVAKGKQPRTLSASPRQGAPTADRYKEIQTALAVKGYLNGEPNGVWDAQSIGAMKRYQTDQKQDPSGKLTAASLIGLGLGPRTASVSSANVRPADVPEPPTVITGSSPQP